MSASRDSQDVEGRRSAAARRLATGGQRDAALDQLADLAALLLRTGSAQVSVISDVQDVMGGSGAAATSGSPPSASVDSLCNVTLHGSAPLVVSVADEDPRVAHLPPVRSGVVGSYLGVPLRTETGATIGALCVFDAQVREWSSEDVAMLERLAGPVVAQLELSALSVDYENERLAWRLAVDAAGVGAFEWDLVSGALLWNERLLRLFGLTEESFGGTIEAFNATVHPDDRERVAHALSAAVDTCGEYAAEYRVVRPDGDVRWIAARGRAVPGPDGSATRVLGAAYDTTAGREGAAQVARILEAMPSAFFQLGRDWRFSYVNAEAERLLGSSRAALTGGDIWETFPAAVGSDFETHYRQAMSTGVATTFEAYYPAPLDAWYEVRAWPSPDGLSVYFVDITARHEAREQLAQAASRNAFTAAVTANLTETLDVNEAVSRLAPMIVPLLGDWCLVSIVQDDDAHAPWRRRLRDVGWWHVEPRMRPVLERYAAVRVPALTDDSFVARALSTRAPVVVESDASSVVSAVLSTDEARGLLRELDPASAVVVQMRGRGRVAGMLSVFRGPDRAPFPAEDITTLVDVATRSGLALDTAQAFTGQRDLAETLQRGLLSEPPQPDGLQIAVRYEPAAEQAQVGGDWYDAFLQPGGDPVLAIGDVVGHDTAAAAAMGQVRSLLRGIAVHTGDGPADVLNGVDRALETLLEETTATAVVARLEQSPEERESQTMRLRWANAGHPPPLVLHHDLTVSTLTGSTTDLLLGFDASTERREHVVTLERGATLLLYTDGLVERRDESIDEGIDRLAGALRSLGTQGLSLEELCDQVLRTMLPDRPDDDVALVAVRLHRQDGSPDGASSARLGEGVAGPHRPGRRGA